MLTGPLGGTTNYELEDEVTHGAELSTFKRKHDLNTFTPEDEPEVAAVFEPNLKKDDVEGSSEAH